MKMKVEEQTSMEDQNPQTALVELDAQTLGEDKLKQIMDLYSAGYGERWIGNDRFLKETMPNTSTIDLLMQGDDLVGAVNLNRNRIITISIAPHFQGRGLGVELFRQVAARHPDVWISVGIDARDMLQTITNPSLNFDIIENKATIESLYKGIRGVPNDFSVEIEELTGEEEKEFLTSRLAQKGVAKDHLTTFTKSGSLHDSTYQQILFQNQLNTTS